MYLAASTFDIVIIVVVAVVGLVVFGIIVSFFSVWLRAWLAGAYVGFTDLIAMRLRQVPYGMVVDARITAKKAGIDINIDDIEAHFLAGGNVIPTVQALIAAQKAGIPFVAICTGVYEASAFQNEDCLLVLEDLGNGSTDRILEALEETT